MTRRVRSGSTQKHKKMPGEATKWGEFDNQRTNKISPKKKNMKNESTAEQSCNSVSMASNSSTNKIFDLCENKRKFSEEQTTHVVSERKKSKKKIKLAKANSYEIHSNKISSNSEQKVDPNDSPEKSIPNISTMEKGSNLKKKKMNKMKDGSESTLTDNKSLETTPTKVFNGKRKMYLKKLQEKRDKIGILLLPSKVERKLYNIRNILKKKGYSSEMQKEILRKERRKEELKFRKTFNPSKLCFHCREPGHLFADCPKKSDSLNQETGICFKCGSSEHTSYKCPQKVKGFPFAKCFICKEQGHISKDCSKNQHGIYPKGGKCNLCGNVNHLRKDCPSLIKKKNDESNITLHTINEDASMDAEIIEKEDVKRKKVKKPKVVKF